MRHLWIGAIVWGVALVVLGSVFIIMGNDAKGDVKEALRVEQVKTSKDAELFGVGAGLLVEDVKTAEAQALVIRYHSLTGDKKVVDGQIVGGTSYAGMTKEDPARATFLNGLTLTTSLNMAVMAFRLSDFIMGVGATLLLIGMAGLGLLAPALYALRNGYVNGTATGAAKAAVN